MIDGKYIICSLYQDNVYVLYIRSNIFHLLHDISDTDLLNTHINNKTKQGIEVSLCHGTAGKLSVSVLYDKFFIAIMVFVLHV